MTYAAAELTAECAIDFVKQLDLPAASLSRITDSIANLNAWTTIGMLVLWLLFPELAYYPGTPQYTATQQINWSLRARLPAALTFIPETSDDISKALPVLSFFSVPFAIRSGGHTPYPGASSSDGGVLVSLEKFTQLSLSADKKIVSVGPGNRWVNVYDYLQPQGVLAVGGRVPPVGVGGLITGGGNSYFSNRYGMACDMVQSFEVVLANGTIFTVSAKKNPDLFKALKGGSNNFGIVTKFNLYTVPSPNGVWGGVTAYTPDKYPKLAKALENYQTKWQIQDPDAAMIQNIFFAQGGALQAWSSILFHATTDNPVSLQEWKDVGPVADTTKHTTLPALVREVYASAENQTLRQDFRTLTIGVSSSLYLDITTLFSKAYTPIASVPGLQVTLTFQPMGVSIFEAGEKKGGNVLGVKHIAQTWIDLTPAWSNEADDKKVLAVGKKFLDDVAKMAEKRGLLYDYLFLNDAAKDQNVIASYGKKQVRFLKSVSARYDPEQVFQKLVGGFKLP
ncbi:FAD-binding domain-containing protein [Wilcoxina mikolae CBS 423.85]|nr:FAD-binding domain-containing protein [Wilcoxina mikolae CBS 423.85]